MSWNVRTPDGEVISGFANELEAVVEAFGYDGYEFAIKREEESGEMIALTSTHSRNSSVPLKMYKIEGIYSELEDDEEAKLDVARQLIEAFPYDCHSRLDVEVFQED